MKQKSNGTHLIPMELMMVLFFFAICGSILLQVFVKAHNISAKAREMTETKNYVTQAAELIEAGAYDIKDFQEYFKIRKFRENRRFRTALLSLQPESEPGRLWVGI